MKGLSLSQLETAKELLSHRDHGGGARFLEQSLGLNDGHILDLSASMNPVVSGFSAILERHMDSLLGYPETHWAREALADAISVPSDQLLLTNGGAEAIALVSRVLPSGWVSDPEFSLYRRHIKHLDPNGPWWASNPNNPTGALLPSDQRPKVVDEAFYPLATGQWSRRDFEHGSLVVGSLTKLFSLPGLRMGYVIAPDSSACERLSEIQPRWSVNSLAAAVLPELLEAIDLVDVSKKISHLRSELTGILSKYGLQVFDSKANYLYVAKAADIFERLLAGGILVRKTDSFGLPGGVRIAVPDSKGIMALEQTLFPKQSRSRTKPLSKKSLMIVGTTSDSGKSTLVTALCRVLSNKGLSVAPFKAQNMSLNSVITPDGYEIGRAQARQAYAARTEPRVEMNPVLIKPNSDLTSQVVVMGLPVFNTSAFDYQKRKAELFDVVISAYEKLSSQHDLVVIEGAGSPAEINLADYDIVNLSLAKRVEASALLVGDIDRGGVFASMFGTIEILPKDLSSLIVGFVINKLRGDAKLLDSGITILERRTSKRVFGVLPVFDHKPIDSEDSMGLTEYVSRQVEGEDALDVVIIGLPRFSNFTDFDPLVYEPGCRVRIANHPSQLHGADLVIIPGTKATVNDLIWLRDKGFEAGIRSAIKAGSIVLGICGGFQMLGNEIADGIESSQAGLRGLGLLNVFTEFLNTKVTLVRNGVSPLFDGVAINGYQIHQGRVHLNGGPSLFELGDPVRRIEVVGNSEGTADPGRQIFGTTLHGIFENDKFRERFLSHVAAKAGKSFVSNLEFDSLRQRQVDFLADFVDKHLDLNGLFEAASIYL